MSVTDLVFATRNPHKVREVAQMLDGQFRIVGLEEVGLHQTIPETRNSISGNAVQKAEFVYERCLRDCFAEDTGLEVEALDGAPGVDTAHYAGPERDAQANMQRVLRELEGHDNRRARFRTVIALILHGEVHTFEGWVRGEIGRAPRGSGGFGYDPIFIPEGKGLTFAEMDAAEKNSLSHRARALAKLKAFLLEAAPPEA